MFNSLGLNLDNLMLNNKNIKELFNFDKMLRLQRRNESSFRLRRINFFDSWTKLEEFDADFQLYKMLIKAVDNKYPDDMKGIQSTSCSGRSSDIKY